MGDVLLHAKREFVPTIVETDLVRISWSNRLVSTMLNLGQQLVVVNDICQFSKFVILK